MRSLTCNLTNRDNNGGAGPFLCFFVYNIVFLEPGCGAVCAGVWGPALRRCQPASAAGPGALWPVPDPLLYDLRYSSIRIQV